jgi:hypothetical protein
MAQVGIALHVFWDRSQCVPASQSMLRPHRQSDGVGVEPSVVAHFGAVRAHTHVVELSPHDAVEEVSVLKYREEDPQ